MIDGNMRSRVLRMLYVELVYVEYNGRVGSWDTPPLSCRLGVVFVSSLSLRDVLSLSVNCS